MVCNMIKSHVWHAIRLITEHYFQSLCSPRRHSASYMTRKTETSHLPNFTFGQLLQNSMQTRVSSFIVLYTHQCHYLSLNSSKTGATIYILNWAHSIFWSAVILHFLLKRAACNMFPIQVKVIRLARNTSSLSLKIRKHVKAPQRNKLRRADEMLGSTQYWTRLRRILLDLFALIMVQYLSGVDQQECLGTTNTLPKLHIIAQAISSRLSKQRHNP